MIILGPYIPGCEPAGNPWVPRREFSSMSCSALPHLFHLLNRSRTPYGDDYGRHGHGEHQHRARHHDLHAADVLLRHPQRRTRLFLHRPLDSRCYPDTAVSNGFVGTYYWSTAICPQGYTMGCAYDLFGGSRLGTTASLSRASTSNSSGSFTQTAAVYSASPSSRVSPR